MQDSGLNCDCCESRKDLKPLSYLEGELGGINEGIPKKSVFSAESTPHPPPSPQ